MPVKKGKIFIIMNKHSKKLPILSAKRVFFNCGASERCFFLQWSLSRRLINLSFVLGDGPGKFRMGVTSQDRFAGMGDLVCYWKDWREAEMPHQ